MKLLNMVFQDHRWQETIDKAITKGMKQINIDPLCQPATRQMLQQQIQKGVYKITPPRIAKIPKPDGGYREVFINSDVDRCLLSIINDCLLELFSDFVHPSCKSYQKGLSSQRTVKETSAFVAKATGEYIGIKADLSKYFDTVNRKSIYSIFDRIEQRIGVDPIITLLRDYYQNDTVFIKDKKVTQYGGLKQGCAVASFLANVILYDVDKKLTNSPNVHYVRYGDDILLLSPDYGRHLRYINRKIQKYGLTLNPKKLEFLRKDTWFTFLGFAMKDDQIALSKRRLHDFRKQIIDMTLKTSNVTARNANRRILRTLFKGEHSWASACLTTINNQQDIASMNTFITDCLRALEVREQKNAMGYWIPISAIGNIGFERKKQQTITRGTGSNVRRNREYTPVILPYYTSLQELRNVMMTNQDAYHMTLEMALVK